MCLARVVERLRASVRACLTALGVRLRELDDWICCGATAAHRSTTSWPWPCRRGTGHGRARRPDRSAGPLPDVLDGADQGRPRAGRLRRCARKCPRSSNCRSPARRRCCNLIQVFQQIGVEKIQQAAVAQAGRVPPGLLLRLPAHAAAARRCSSTIASSPVRWRRCCGPWGPSRSSGTTRPNVAARA